VSIAVPPHYEATTQSTCAWSMVDKVAEDFDDE
jgi:hypothetical protein